MYSGGLSRGKRGRSKRGVDYGIYQHPFEHCGFTYKANDSGREEEWFREEDFTTHISEGDEVIRDYAATLKPNISNWWQYQLTSDASQWVLSLRVRVVSKQTHPPGTVRLWILYRGSIGLIFVG